MNLSAKLDAFGQAPSQETFSECLMALRDATVFIGVGRLPGGAVRTPLQQHPAGGMCLPAFLDSSAASAWWKNVDGIVVQQVVGSSLIQVAANEGVAFLLIEPQDRARCMELTRQQYEQLVRLWEVGLG